MATCYRMMRGTMNTLLVNLTRFGDLLQMQPVISGFARSGRRVGLVCLDNFAPATALLRDVDAVYPLTGGGLLAALDADWRGALGRLWRWSEEAAAFEADEVLNLTATLSVRLLASHLVSRRALPAGETEGQEATRTALRGFGLDVYGFGMNSDPWSTFLQASTRLRGCSPFNLVDLYWKAAGLDALPGAGERVYSLRTPQPGHAEAAEALLAGAPCAAEVQGFVALQLGASEDRRRWPVAHFAALGDMLWRSRRLLPVLLGAGSEAHLGERYAAAATEPHLSLIGRTDLPVLAAVLRRMRLLASNDTGTMHLAAGLGVPVLAVFLATAQPWDTGPYLEGSCSLEPDMDCHPCPFGKPCPHEHACRSRVSAQTVFSLADAWLEQGAWRDPGTGEARVWVARRGTDGGMDLASLSGHEEADRTQWVRLQRHFYSQFLDRPSASLARGDTRVRTIEPPVRPCGLSEQAGETVRREILQASQLLHLLAEQGKLLAARPTDMAKQRFLGTWQRLQTLWDNSAYFNVLGYLWMCESQEAGGDLPAMLALAQQYAVLMAAWAQGVEA